MLWLLQYEDYQITVAEFQQTFKCSIVCEKYVAWDVTGFPLIQCTAFIHPSLKILFQEWINFYVRSFIILMAPYCIDVSGYVEILNIKSDDTLKENVSMQIWYLIRSMWTER